MSRVLLVMLLAAVCGCRPGAAAAARASAPPWMSPYSGYPVFVPPGPPPVAAPLPAPESKPALELPPKPGPFGRLSAVKLGQPRDEVVAQLPGILQPGGIYEPTIKYSVSFRDGRVESMRVLFDDDPRALLVARWGEPVPDGSAVAWLAAEDGLRVVLDSSQQAVYIRPYIPLSKLLRNESGKLGGLVAEVLAMDRKVFEARFPSPTLRTIGRDVLLAVTFPPVEASERESEIEARFDPAGALRAVELDVQTGVEEVVRAALTAVHGPPKELPLCPPPKKPCLVVSGVWQADPVLRYGKGSPEITTWPHDWAHLTVRVSRQPTRTDHFTTLTPPDRVRETE